MIHRVLHIFNSYSYTLAQKKGKNKLVVSIRLALGVLKLRWKLFLLLVASSSHWLLSLHAAVVAELSQLESPREASSFRVS